MPNFLIIGAAKAGTTTLYHYLKQHPQIYMSPIKEPNFFAFEGKKLSTCKSGNQQRLSQSSITYVGDYRARTSVTNIEAYQTLFQGVSNETAIGEASPLYLYSLRAPERIQHYIPEVKLIAILRNPVERAYSSNLMRIRQGREMATDFAQALQAETQHNNLEEVHYVRKGFYYAQLRHYFDKFNKEQIKVYLYEDLSVNVTALLRDIFRFLGVDETFVPDTSIRYNASGIPKNKVLHRAFQKELKPIMAALKLLLPNKLYTNLRAQYFQNNLVKPQLPPEVRKQLIDACREDILKLQDLLQRDLSAWLE